MNDSLPGKMFDKSVPEIQKWMAEGRALVHAASSHQWAIADWILEGEKMVGIRAAYDLAEEATGFPRKTLTEYAYVARNLSIRYGELSFGHHQAVAPLIPEAQKRLLERATAEKIPILELREIARWEPRRVETEGDGAPEDVFLSIKIHAREIDRLQIQARYLGYKSNEHFSGVGIMIRQIVAEYIKSHPEIQKVVEEKYRQLKGEEKEVK